VDLFTFGSNILTALIGAGLATALVNGLIESRRAASVATTRATYLATRLIVGIEAYIDECSKSLHDLSIAPNDEWHPALPEAPILPEDHDGWLALDGDLRTRALLFGQTIRDETIKIELADLHDGPPFGQYASELALCRVARSAVQLSTAIRTKYTLPKRDETTEEWLNEQIAKLERKHADEESA
jgi:hypothetical protein